MARYRPHHSLGQRQVIRLLYRWARKHFGDAKYRPHQKVSDAMLVALLLSRLVFKHAYPSIWWTMLKDRRPGLPSYTQAFTRGGKLLEQLEALAMPSKKLTHAVIDSAPNERIGAASPVSSGGMPRSGQGPKPLWSQPSSRECVLREWPVLPKTRPGPGGGQAAHAVRSAQDVPFWPGQGYCCLGFVFPPKKNTTYDTGWRDEVHGKMRKRVETVFSQWVKAHLRAGQLKTMTSLRLKVVLAVLAHNLCHP